MNQPVKPASKQPKWDAVKRAEYLATLQPVTSANCTTVQNFVHMYATNADGSPLRARRNGKTQQWKTRTGNFRIPIKIGLYGYGEIIASNNEEWKVAE